MNAALAILGVVAALVVYSAVNSKFKVPEPMWGVATVAAAYLFSSATASRELPPGDDDDEEEDERRDS